MISSPRRGSSRAMSRPLDGQAVDLDSSCGDSGISNASSRVSPSHCYSASQPHASLLSSEHPMAMSSISEVPSNDRSSAQPPASQEEFDRANRLTQSLSYGKGVSAQSRRQMLAHSIAMMSHEHKLKQKDLSRREKEVSDATAKATEQVEYMLKLTERVHKFEDENSKLRQQVAWYETEMNKLIDDLQEREAELEEKQDELDRSNAYCHELQSELGRSRKDIAQIRTRADQLKVENSVLNQTKTDGVRGVAEWDELKRNNQRLQRQLQQSEKEQRRLRRETETLQTSLDELQSEHQRMMDDFGDDERSKKELLQMIRHLIEDKMAWESYCSRLIRKAIESAPQLLCLDAAAVATGNEAESRWQRLFDTLFKAVMQKEPALADCVAGQLPEANEDRFAILQQGRQHPQHPQHPQQHSQHPHPQQHQRQRSQRSQRPILQPQLRSAQYSRA